MNPALLVLNPRQIPSCIQAISALDIPTCWLSNMNEPTAAKAANRAIRDTDYTHYAVLSDDTRPTQATLDLILRYAGEHPAVTGYCNLDEAEHLDIVNLTSNPLPPPPPQASSYQFMTRNQAEQQHGSLIPTTFAGLSVTVLTRDLWLEHPLHVSAHGGQMDYTLSYSLAQHGVPIVAPNGAYVHHVKERWNHQDQSPLKQLLVGRGPEAVTWTNLPVPA